MNATPADSYRQRLNAETNLDTARADLDHIAELVKNRGGLPVEQANYYVAHAQALATIALAQHADRTATALERIADTLEHPEP